MIRTITLELPPLPPLPPGPGGGVPPPVNLRVAPPQPLSFMLEPLLFWNAPRGFKKLLVQATTCFNLGRLRR